MHNMAKENLLEEKMTHNNLYSWRKICESGKLSTIKTFVIIYHQS